MSATGQKISRRSIICQKCEQPMKDGTTCFSTLMKDEESWTRTDICQDCITDEIQDQALAVWKTEILSQKKKAFVLSEDAIWQVLRKAKDDEELREQPLTFILCLMMARKRKLRTTKNWKKNGHEFQNFINLSRKIELDIKVPLLGPAAFSRLQKEISEFFKEED